MARSSPVSTGCPQERRRVRSPDVARNAEGLGATVDQIAGIPLFAALSRDEQARVASVSRVLHLRVGEAVVSEGEFAFDFYC